MATASPALVAALAASIANPDHGWRLTTTFIDEHETYVFSMVDDALSVAMVPSVVETYALQRDQNYTALTIMYRSDNHGEKLEFSYGGASFTTSNLGLLTTLRAMAAEFELETSSALVLRAQDVTEE